VRVLLLRSADVADGGDWAWVPPGGGREPGEEIAACAARELVEETGIVGIPAPVEVDDVGVAVFRLVVPWGTPVRLSDEHSAYEWVDREGVEQRCRPAPLLESVRKGLAWG
jgi:8-oxo-dGTP pyrophosphatase MutT (NUDIX family)